MKKLLILGLVVLGVLLGGRAEGQGSETFANLPTASSSSYNARSWTGDDVVTWTAEGARTDQTLTAKAITWGSSGTRNVISPTYSGGMGTLTFKYVRAFTSTSARSLEVYVNSVLKSSITVSPNSDAVQTFSQAINVSGNIVLEIRSTGAAQVKVDDIAWDAYASCTPPTTQASAFGTSNILSTQMDAAWMRGDGANVLVVARSGSAVNADPVNAMTYTASATFGSGTQIGTGNYVVYNGIGTSVTVTGLTQSTAYHYAVYEYDGTAGSECYRASDELTGNATTLAGPSITVTPTTLTGFTYVAGAGPSASQSYTLSGANLDPAADNITVAASANYEVSIDDATYTSSSFTVPYTASTLANTTIYVRLKAGLSAGTYNGETVANSGGGTVSSQNVTCNGSVTQPPSYFRTKASGLWSEIATWEVSTDEMNWSDATAAPTTADLGVSLLSPHNVTISTSVSADQLSVSGELTVNSGVTLTIANGLATDLLIDGTLVNNGSITLQGTTSSIVNGTFSNSGTVTMNTVSTNLTVNGTFDQLSGGTLTNASAGPITFAAGSTYKHSKNGGVIPTATWNITSLCNVTGVGATAPTGLGQTFGQFTWNCTGQSSNLDLALSGFGTTGMFTVSSTNTSYINMNPSSSALTASIYGINISGGSKLSLNNTSSTTGYTTLNIGNGGLTVAGTNTTVEFAGGSTNVTGFYRTTINLTGNISLGTGTIVRANSSSDFGQIFYTGNTEQNFTSSITTTRIDHNIAVGAMLKLLSNFNLRSASSTDYDQLEVLGTLNTGAFAVAASSGTFSLVYVYGGATIQTANSTGLNTALGASLRTIEAGANYVFDAATITAFPTTAQVATFGNPANVTVNANITINRALTIDGILTLAAGNLTLGANTLTISATGSIAGANSTNYIITNGAGKLKRNSVTSTTAFPIGSASVYTPVTLTNAGTSDDFSVSFTETTAACVPAATSVTGTWDISESAAGGSDCTISIDYGSSAKGASFVGADAKIGHCSGTTMDYNSGSASGSLVAGSGFTSFSPFGITSISALPVELLSFNATKQSNHTLLSFATASERNNARFEIERSADGRVFQVIGAVKGAGDAQTQNNYTFTDEHPMRGINYYRLRQVDVDGASTLSQVVSVTFGKTGNVVLYPTPASETMNVRFDEAFTTDANWQIVDLTGRILNEGIFAAEQVEFRIPVASLTQGAYILRVTANNEVVTQQFRKQ